MVLKGKFIYEDGFYEKGSYDKNSSQIRIFAKGKNPLLHRGSRRKEIII
jgi:hypothetical protein